MVVGTILDAPLEKMAVPEKVKQSIRDFPYKVSKSGRCEKLGADLKCTVYEDRPLFCRVDAYYNELKEKPLLDDYYKETEAQCKVLMQTELGMTEKEIKAVYDDI